MKEYGIRKNSSSRQM